MTDCQAAAQHLAHLERRWATTAASRQAQLEALLLRTAALAAALHYSRCLAWRWGLAPWRALLQRARDMEAAALALAAKHRMQRALQAWQHCRQAALWQAAAAEACATAAARRQRQRALLTRGMVALAQHASWARGLAHCHNARLVGAALGCWRAAAAQAAAEVQQRGAEAAGHWARGACRRALAAWRRGVVRCRQERLVKQRREQRWGAVQQYLAEHRAAKQAAAAACAAAGKGGGSGGGGSACSVLSLQPSLSSPENSFDPNGIFFAGPGPAH